MTKTSTREGGWNGPREQVIAAHTQCLSWVIFVRLTRSRRPRHVRLAPITSEPSHRSESARCANSGFVHRRKMTCTSCRLRETGPPFVPAAATHRAILIGIVGGGKASIPIMLRLLDGSGIASQRYTLGIR
jgi:hypothetical protein